MSNNDLLSDYMKIFLAVLDERKGSVFVARSARLIYLDFPVVDALTCATFSNVVTVRGRTGDTSRLAEGNLGSRHPLRVLSLTPTHRHLRLEWCRARGNWPAVEWNHVVFRDEFRFNLSSDDNLIRVWRTSGERLNPAFALQRHTAPTAGVTVWGAIAYNTWSPPWHVHNILQPHVLPLMQ
ncbi:transposable element Tcb2 transposase [Trichonephila clavipes]|nr:transposable element Tcb2 transposase [Trichonephila clavipes]